MMFKVILNSLSVKIFALFWFIFALLLVSAFFIPQLDTRLYIALNSKEVNKYHQDIINAVRSQQFSRLLVTPEVFIEEQLNSSRPVLVDEAKNIIGAKENELGYIQDFMKYSTDLLRPQRKTFYDLSIAGPFSIHLNSDEQQYSYFAYFITYVDPQKEIANYIFDRPFLLLILLMLVSTPILAWLAYNLTEPIRRLQRAANSVATGDFRVNPELEKTGVVELRQVGRSFNQMSQSLATLINTQRQMMSTASHELRTPLTRMQLAASLIRRKMGDSSELQRIENETNRLNTMVSDLLLVSATQIKNSAYREHIKLPEMWQDVLQDAWFEAQELNIQMQVRQQIKSPENYQIYGNLEGLSSMLENVIRNALKYTHSLIEVNFSVQDNTLLIQVDDNGEGLSPTEYERIFSPFYRVDEYRTQQKTGTGLGLAIVQNTVQSHQGKVWAEKSPLGGLRITIKLPLWQN
ncbi:envelope stress sensor histidine kinase CpxA [Lonepinella sp. BR2357]|uniref:envelope stress sensor histidine kinase CpxA n=1 Tax=Lonepinella sp. BR2357 TaxID=3434549 RepID=UPI003F6DF7E5